MQKEPVIEKPSRTRGKVINSLIRPRATEYVAVPEEDTFTVVSAMQIGDANKRRVLQTLFDLGPTSRADLARLSGTMRTTISGIVQPLIDGGLLVEEAPAETRGVGKPARPLWLSADASPVCAVTVRSGVIRSGMVSLRGEVYGQQCEVIAKGISDPAAYLAAIKNCVTGALATSRGEALGIGIAVDGMVDPETGSIVEMSQAPWMADIAVASIVEEAFQKPTVIDHLPRAILMGERWFGRGRGLKDFAIIYADEGLACSLFLDGQPFRGPRGSGGELGHTIVSVNGQICTCGRKGCWETIATLRWLRSRAGELQIENASILTVPTLCEIAKTSAVGDTLLREYAYNLAVGIANLQTLLMPGNYLLYGDAGRGSAQLLEMIQTFVDQLAFSHAKDRAELAFGIADQESITLRGAAGLVIAEELKILY